MVALESDRIEVPEFSMQPKVALFSSIGKAIGVQYVEFDDHPEFSKMFSVKGKDEAAIRQFFNTKLRDCFTSIRRANFEGKQSKLIFYDRHARPEQIKELFASAYKVFGHIVDEV